MLIGSSRTWHRGTPGHTEDPRLCAQEELSLYHSIVQEIQSAQEEGVKDTKWASWKAGWAGYMDIWLDMRPRFRDFSSIMLFLVNHQHHENQRLGVCSGMISSPSMIHVPKKESQPEVLNADICWYKLHLHPVTSQQPRMRMAVISSTRPRSARRHTEQQWQRSLHTSGPHSKPFFGLLQSYTFLPAKKSGLLQYSLFWSRMLSSWHKNPHLPNDPGGFKSRRNRSK